VISKRVPCGDSRPRLSYRAKPGNRATVASFAQFCRLDVHMKAITVTTARKRFGFLLDSVQHEPLLILRKNRDESVVISAEEYGRIRGLESANPKRVQVNPVTNGP
jgi:prevent-host-death family protein